METDNWITANMIFYKKNKRIAVTILKPSCIMHHWNHASHSYRAYLLCRWILKCTVFEGTNTSITLLSQLKNLFCNLKCTRHVAWSFHQCTILYFARTVGELYLRISLPRIQAPLTKGSRLCCRWDSAEGSRQL